MPLFYLRKSGIENKEKEKKGIMGKLNGE